MWRCIALYANVTIRGRQPFVGPSFATWPEVRHGRRDMAELSISPELAAGPKTAKQTNFLLRLGPGLITGSADDDPSGIATYSQVGAQFGLGMLWTMLFSFPLMAATQEICARLGRITGVGVAKNLRKNYPKQVIYGMVLLLCVANVFNLAADISAMGAALQLVVGGPTGVYALALVALS